MDIFSILWQKYELQEKLFYAANQDRALWDSMILSGYWAGKFWKNLRIGRNNHLLFSAFLQLSGNVSGETCLAYLSGWVIVWFAWLTQFKPRTPKFHISHMSVIVDIFRQLSPDYAEEIAQWPTCKTISFQLIPPNDCQVQVTKVQEMGEFF